MTLPLPLTVYGYMKCDTCRKALKWLDANGKAYTFIDITTDPPSAATLKKLLAEGRYVLKHLFNTSGRRYRELDIKQKLPDMTQAEALKLLAGDGMLVKRPIVTDGQSFTVGFREAIFSDVWG